MTFDPRLRRVTFIVAVLGMLSLALAEMNLVYLALITIVAVVAWSGERHQSPTLLSRWALNVVILLAIGWAVVDYSVLGSGWIVSLAHFLLIAQMAKLLLPKSDRDYAQIYVISLMNVAVAAIVTVNLAFALAFVLYSGFTIFGLILFHFHVELTHAPHVYLPAQSEMVRPTTSPDMSRVISHRFLWTLVTVILTAWVFNAVFFLFSPRVPAGLIRLTPSGFLTRLTGFSESISLGQMGDLLENDDPVMHVRLRDRDGEIIRGERDLYFRGLTYQYYNGRDWKHLGPNVSTRNSVRTENLPFQLTRLTGDPGRTPDWITQEITLEPINTRTLFAMPGVLQIDAPAVKRIHVNTLDQTYALVTRPQRPIRYTVASYASPDRRLLPKGLAAAHRPFLHDWERPAYVLLPNAISSDVRDLAGDIVPNRPQLNNLEVAGRIEEHLRNDYAYTLSTRPNPDVEPVHDFLFNLKEGHCEYFASAMVVLVRSLDVPARLVSGFHGAEWNEVGGWHIVRQRHAHAWVEVYSPTHGWVRFDPTPGDDRDGGPSTSRFAFLGRWLDYLRTQWVNHVVEYDEDQQTAVVKRTRDMTRRFRLGLRRVFRSAGRFLASVLGVFTDMQRLSSWEGILTIVAVLIVSTVIVLLMRWLVLRMMRSIRADLRERHARRLGRAHVAFYRDLQRVLKRRGFVRLAADTPREFAERVADDVAEAKDALAELTDVFYRVRFGGRALTPDEERRIRDVIETIRSTPAARSG